MTCTAYILSGAGSYPIEAVIFDEDGYCLGECMLHRDVMSSLATIGTEPSRWVNEDLEWWLRMPDQRISTERWSRVLAAVATALEAEADIYAAKHGLIGNAAALQMAREAGQ